MARLTVRRLDAIIESLNARLAGEWNAEGGDADQRDYQAALEWAQDERARRQSASAKG